MNLPFFYITQADACSTELILDEDNSRHVVSVLRMQLGAQLHLTDGRGLLITAAIADPHKKKCRVNVTGIQHTAQVKRKTGIAISLVKNPVRFEWFLEKAAEIGITEIFPLLCSRTEKQHFRFDRMKNVLVSALLQSRQTWLPQLHEPLKFDAITRQEGFQQKFIAHCLEDDKKNLGSKLINPSENQLILIGPEGDFTTEEIAHALQLGFTPVALGATRLRTETAGMVAAVLLKNAE
ncbi:MAG: RsmE family RNA methyltransferase [Chitinophagaceae bacterium]